jgi:acetate---CoA ligase (ADP-forming)
MIETGAYPASQEVDVALRDGSPLHVRPVRLEDRDAIQDLLGGLSMESRVYRFFGLGNLAWAADWSVDVDYANSYAIVGELGLERRIVAHGSYARTGSRSAEVAFVVADAWHGHGIATLMLSHLAGVAREHGIERFTAIVMGGNHKMVEVFRQSGFATESRLDEGEYRIEFPTALTAEAMVAFERREHRSAANAVRQFLAPDGIAVIGASRRDGAVGTELLHNLVAYGYKGDVYPVNRHGGQIDGLRAYKSVHDLPRPVGLAVIVVPADGVVAAAGECADAGVRALLVISAGFGETGAEGRRQQGELLTLCRRTGMRLIGPNCLGVINTDPDVRLDATFAGRQPPAGTIGFLSQSGGLGIALIEAADRLGLGLSSFVSVGNKADISGNDLLEYWEQDPRTEVILLYLESFGNPRRFARIARRVSRSKPILAVKAGRSPAGARATTSHTGALLSASDATVDALFRQAGVIRADTIGELLDTASLLCAQPVPRGRRVAIVTNAGGPGIVCADACQAAGLDVIELPDEVRAELAAFLSSAAALSNPVDMIATATAEDYRRTIEVLVRSEVCDAIVAAFVPPLVTRADDVARALDEAATISGDVALLGVFMDRDLPAGGRGGRGSVPRFQFPEDAVRALVDAARYGEWRGRSSAVAPAPPDCDEIAANSIIKAALSNREEWLRPSEVDALLRAYGLPLIRTAVCRETRAAVAAALEIGGRVALKGYGPDLLHKSDCDAVKLGLEGEDQVRAAARSIKRSVKRRGHELTGFVVQPMAHSGVELIAGVVHDELFGPVIACGAGGHEAELLGDVAVRITPLSSEDPREMLESLRTFPLLQGYRGEPGCDQKAIEDVLVRLSALVEAHPEIAELDANPLIAGPDGAVIVDARVRLEPAVPERPLGALAEASHG